MLKGNGMGSRELQSVSSIKSLQEETVLLEASLKVIKMKICLAPSERFSHPKREASLSCFPKERKLERAALYVLGTHISCPSKMHHPQRGRVTQTLKGLFIGSKWEVSFAAVKSADTIYHVPQKASQGSTAAGLVRFYTIEYSTGMRLLPLQKLNREKCL